MTLIEQTFNIIIVLGFFVVVFVKLVKNNVHNSNN